MNSGKIVSISIIAILWIVYFSAGRPMFMNSDLPWLLRASLHHFFHANIFHISVNTLSIWFLYRRQNKKCIIELLCSWAIATLAFVASSEEKPTIGFSDMLYAVCGFRFLNAFPNWKKDHHAWVFLAMLSLFCLMPGTSSGTHILSFALSATASLATRKIKETQDDFRRASHK